MPRPKSDLQRHTTTSVRLTPLQQIAWLRLGGSAWLRSMLDREMRENPGLMSIPRSKAEQHAPQLD